MNVINTCNMIIMNRIHVPSPLLINPFRASKSLPQFKCRCTTSSDEEKNVSGSNDFNDALSGIVGSQVEELLSRKENRVMLDGLEKATQRVETAKSQLAMIEQQELAVKQFKDYIDQLEDKASENVKEISEAKALVEEAERTLSLNAGGPKDGGAFMGMGSEEIDRDEERLESVKAASISALVGTIAALPICCAQVTNPTQLLLTLAINFISCALFGVTFR